MDLLDWAEAFKPPFNPWVELIEIPARENTAYVLRSNAFDRAKSSEEVHSLATLLVDRLNGAVRISVGGEKVSYQGVLEFALNGSIKHHYVASVGTASLRIRGSAVGLAMTVDGVEIPPPTPQMSSPQKWIEVADPSLPRENSGHLKEELVADLLSQAGRCDNWFDIYKTIEFAEKLSGGEHKLRSVIGVDGAALKDARSTANFYRHARANRPKVMTSISDARRLALMAAKFSLDTLDHGS